MPTHRQFMPTHRVNRNVRGRPPVPLSLLCADGVLDAVVEVLRGSERTAWVGGAPAAVGGNTLLLRGRVVADGDYGVERCVRGVATVA
jgi:hypothetical protein